MHVAIVGDVLHSSVARSLVQALALVGADASLVGPPTLLPRGIEALGCSVSYDIDAIADADVVYVLRMQHERMAGRRSCRRCASTRALYGITPARVRPGQVVMHPGPMNRGVEIDPRVADSDAALVTDQVRAGLVVRMAVLYDVAHRRRAVALARDHGGSRVMLVVAQRPQRLAHARGTSARPGAGHRRVPADHGRRTV